VIDSNPVYKQRKVGIFKISHRLIEDYPDEIIETFRRLGILVIRAESMYYNDCIEYMAYSVFFRSIPQNEIPPRYEIISEKAGTPEWSVRVEEIK
jgi:hypothetical protein